MPVGVPDATRGQGEAGLHQLVPRRQDADAGSGVDDDFGRTLVGQAAEVGRRQLHTGIHHRVPHRDVLSDVAEEGARADGPVDHDDRAPGSGDARLEHAHRVSPGRQGGTGHDPDGLTGADDRLRRRSGQDGADHRERDR